MKWLVMLVLITVASLAFGKPIAIAEFGNDVVTLTDEACELPFLKSDEYRKMEWRSGNKVFTGCYGVNSIGIVVAWTSDRTLAGIPVKMFKKVEGI